MPFKEELVDEPHLGLGRSFQLPQQEDEYGKESWEMCEFLKARAEDVEEEREMLVDEEYEEDSDFLKGDDAPGGEKATSDRSLDTERWAKQLETAEMQDLRSSVSLSPEESLEYPFSKDQMVRSAEHRSLRADSKTKPSGLSLMFKLLEFNSFIYLSTSSRHQPILLYISERF